MPNDSLSRSGNRNRQNAAGKPKGKKKKITAKRVGWTLFFTATLAIIVALAGYLYVMVNGEKLYQANLDKITVNEPSKIYDRNGKLMGELSIEKSEPVESEEIPKLLKDAFVATEDKRFYEHQGVDVWAIGRAAVRDVIARAAVEGGSTITQQLAKNLFLTRDKTFFRKATEVSIATALERNMTKDEILTLYLNRIFFGHQRYGIQAASEYYFGESNLNELKLWQMATLAALPKGPSKYNPLSNPENSKERRGVVLTLMYEQGYITKEQMDEAKAVNYNYEPPASETKYTAFIDYVMDEAEEATHLTSDDLNVGGYEIYTTMDEKAQEALEQAFEDDDLFEKSPDDQPVQGSMVIMNNQNGSIAALLGGRDYQRKGFNRANASRRQPGSALKPIVSYAPALETGNFTSDSRLSNERQCFGKYCPTNLHGYSSTISMQDAITKSENIPAVWLLNQIGVNTGYEFAQNLGITMTEEDKSLAIALGGMSKGTNTLEMAQAYSAFANGGQYQSAYSIKQIKNSEGTVVYEHKSDARKVMDEQTAYQMTDMMQEVVNSGTGKRADIGRPLAGKTGTTQSGIEGNDSNRDVWFVGYTPQYTGAIWMGYDQPDGSHMLKNSSGLAAAFFAKVMSQALEGEPVQDFEKPEGLPETEVQQPEEPVKLSAPAGMSASYNPETQIVSLTWNAAEGENVQYRVYRKEASEANYTPVIEGLSVTNTEDIDATEGSTYEYYVTAYNAEGESEPSNAIQIAIAAQTPPENTQDEGEEQPGGGEEIPPGDGTVPVDPGNQGTQPGDGSGTGENIPGDTSQPGQDAGDGTGAGTGTDADVPEGQTDSNTQDPTSEGEAPEGGQVDGTDQGVETDTGDAATQDQNQGVSNGSVNENDNENNR
ncbi:PBP1A family penicillin-binding protein [Paenibacillus sp. P96]|uniref:PBP1A family penicillin-binding protein n=1 Tax=Paenibacillus zeirhizosphaerae TaxID=2987519 RepID=A0ABT9FP66_9BACL|nr:penicillin-binding protein 1A [Paenibacillus sp. P96]MDP4096533.1 PBP1A family penicillin-binding protein [Paenibacillus sp. P96]